MKHEEAMRLQALTKLESVYWARGELPGGVDEVGRGPLAGPVLAACVILPPRPLIEGVNDSKKLSAKRREALNALIRENALEIGIGIVDEATIDRINIRQATREAMRQAVLQVSPPCILVDHEKPDVPMPCVSLDHGDALSYLIAAASIVAKVKRDAMMDELDKQFPMYGFARNKGYGTKEHIEAIKKYGLCPYHRRSFTGKFV